MVLVDDSGVVDWVLFSKAPSVVNSFCLKYAGVTEACYLEKVSAIRGQGLSSTFSFGKAYGQAIQAAALLGCTTTPVTPQRWQKQHGLLIRRKDYPDLDRNGLYKLKKQMNKAKAQEMFPDVKVTNALADALLIAAYGRDVCSTASL